MKRASDENIPVANKVPRTQSKEKISIAQDPVHVFCRLKPLRGNATSCCVKLMSETTLSLTTDTKSQRKDCNYVFKHVFSSLANQKEVFSQVALPLLEDLVNGKNGLLFTYGITGSGKTFTLTGDQSNPGIMPRCIDTLFNTIGDYQARKFLIKSDKMNGFEIQSEKEASEERTLEIKLSKNYKSLKKNSGDGPYFYVNDGIKVANFTESNKFAVFITYIEIYNNVVYDLLDETAGKVLQSKAIRKDFQNNMYVNGVIEVEVKSAVEAFELFYMGQKRKRMAHTTLNAESSRSHSVFNIRLVQLQQTVQNNQGQQMIPDQNLLRVSQLSLVDLAGSERSNRTQNTGMRLKEASSINNSLMSLRTCLEILRENQLTGSNKLVPYRDSRLTFLFKNYFEGEGQVHMIVCIHPSIEDYEENLQVLKFAEVTQEVKVPRSEVKYTIYKTPKSSKSTRPVQTPSTIKAKKSSSFTYGPKLPSIRCNYEDLKVNEVAVNSLIKALKTRKQKKEMYEKEKMKKEEHFRKYLVEVDQVFVIDKTDTQNLRTLLKKQRHINKNLEFKISDFETINNELISKNSDLQELTRTLQNTLEERNLEINQNVLACEVRKEKLALQNARLLKEHEEKLRRQREHHEVELQYKNAKLKKVKELVDDHELTVTSTHKTKYQDYEPQKTPPMYRRNVHRTLRHRRSRSADEVWLEHNAVKPVPLGTVFQPALKKRKSVTRLDKASDVANSKQNKYCLIAQDTQNGEIETKLYKGDIVPTCGGGAQVIFNEIEKLKQISTIHGGGHITGKP